MEKEKKEKKETKEIKKIEITKEEFEKLKQEIEDANEKFLRSQADLINYRKRKDEEVERYLKYANEDLILDILTVVDNFERALNVEDNTKVMEGIKMIYANLIGILEKFGVKEIDALGKKFDPMFHNAVMTEEDKAKESDIVVEVFQKGYTLKDKVIRPAMVKVNK